MRTVLLLVSCIAVVSARCGVGLSQGPASGDCYKFVSSSDSWYDAESQCENLGGYLASVGNAFTKSFLKSEVPSWCSGDYWLGGSNYEWTTTWAWSDGTPFDYKNWDARQPVSGNALCVAASTTSGKWSAQLCHQAKPYVCKVPALPDVNHTCPPQSSTSVPVATSPATKSSTVTSSARCLVGWTFVASQNQCWQVQNGCYWDSMASICSSAGATLISIHNSTTNDAVATFISQRASRDYGWIPLSGRQGAFTWADGTPLDYQNWADEARNHCQWDADACYVDISAGGDVGGDASFGQWVMYDTPASRDPFICTRPPYTA